MRRAHIYKARKTMFFCESYEYELANGAIPCAPTDETENRRAKQKIPCFRHQIHVARQRTAATIGMEQHHILDHENPYK